MTDGRERIQAMMRAGEQAAWSTAALSLALDATSPPAIRAAAEAVLRAGGVDLERDLAGLDRRNAAAQAAAPIHQAAAVLRSGGQAWQEQSDEALLAQGRASAQAAPMFVQHLMPRMTGMAGALAQRGARMLDVGTGVAALAVAFAEALPELTVVGLDVMPRVLRLAERTREASAARDRVVLREQDVGELDEPETYDLAWIPAPFVPRVALERGVAAVSRALKPGGWVMLGHGKPTTDPLEDALGRLKILAYGGTAIDEAEARELLARAGLAEIAVLPTPPGAPAVTIARRSAV